MKTEANIIIKKKQDDYITVVDSLQIAHLLETKHKYVVATIDKIIGKEKELKTKKKSLYKFERKEFTHNRNHSTFRGYEMNGAAFLKLSMNIDRYRKAEVIQDIALKIFVSKDYSFKKLQSIT